MINGCLSERPLQIVHQCPPGLRRPFQSRLGPIHGTTILATGLYGKDLLPQNGAPVRLVVPWKFGFKSIKSITKIDLVSEMPVSLWMESAPNEYGFYANVNPAVDHPRWSQATERRIGEISRRPSRLFNGYEQEVKKLYEGMDLKKNF